MKLFNRDVLKVFLIAVFIAVFVFLEVYAFWHSKQANLGLAVMTVIAFIYVVRRFAVHPAHSSASSKYIRLAIIAGILLGASWFVVGAFWVKEPQDQAMIAIVPGVISLMAGSAYFVDKSRRHERDPRYHS